MTDLLQHPLGVRSVPGRGTCFTLRLPVQQATAHAVERPAESSIEESAAMSAASSAASSAATSTTTSSAATASSEASTAQPAAQAATAPPLPTCSVAPDPLRGRRVLVIDDDSAVRAAMHGQLLQWGLQVVLAADETEAWAAIADPAAPPHAVLADLRLAGGASGLELALRLRARHGVPPLPVAIITGETDAEPVQAVRSAGLPLLTKPLRPARLRAQLESMLAATET